MNENDLKNIIESLLFVTDTPIDVKTFKTAIPGAESGAIRQAINRLMEDYEQRQGGIKLCEVAGGYQFRTRSGYKEWVKRFLKPAPARISKAALETLAVIAYHQPVIRSDIEAIRGVDSGAILRNLLERKLIRILGKKEIPGRPLIYGTTRKFLEVFNLRSLKDMPSLKEIQEFADAKAPAFGETVADEVTGKPPGKEAPDIKAQENTNKTDAEAPEKSWGIGGHDGGEVPLDKKLDNHGSGDESPDAPEPEKTEPDENAPEEAEEDGPENNTI
ncbi:MAG: SMC-Scp complex subunit ScpB [Thermodesulfobacteriota bacterium]|nr:SMC-Scp complex subunit ScpB [Thermodesulfobacteriota bacterium]